MAKRNDLDKSWVPTRKGQRYCNRDRDKFREKFDDIRKSCGCKFGERCDCERKQD